MFDPSAALRQGMIGLSKNTKVRDVVEKAPVSKDVVKRFVAGTGTDAPAQRRPRGLLSWLADRRRGARR